MPPRALERTFSPNLLKIPSSCVLIVIDALGRRSAMPFFRFQNWTH